MKRIILLLLSALMVLCLASCGKNNEDTGSTYKAESTKDAYGNSAELAITLGEGGKIVSVDWKEYANGVLKDENYGKDLPQEQYESAQKAVAGSATYPKALLDAQDIEKVQAVTGATQSYTNFVQLYRKAMESK